MAGQSRRQRQLSPREYILCYTLYALVVMLSFAVAFIILPPAIVVATIALTNSRWIIRGVYPFSMVFLALIWLILVVGSNSYLCNGLAQQRLWPRFMRLVIPLLAAGGLGLLLTRWPM